MHRFMQVHLFQLDITWEDRAPNFDRLITHCERLTIDSGDLVVIPEMFSTGFSMNADRIAEPIDGQSPATETLGTLAKEFACCVVGGVAVRDGGEFYNEAIAALPGGRMARYRKHQGFSVAGEDSAYREGDRLTTLDWGLGRIGLTICYDLRFPEIYRALAFAGAELLINIANWPRRRVEHWVTLLRARAIENQCYVAGVNRVGEDPNSHYPGRSILVDPQGEIIADAGGAEGVVSCPIDFETVRTWRAEFPALRDARRANPPVDHFTCSD